LLDGSSRRGVAPLPTIRRAVAGMSCMSPRAPTGDTASGSNKLS